MGLRRGEAEAGICLEFIVRQSLAQEPLLQNGQQRQGYRPGQAEDSFIGSIGSERFVQQLAGEEVEVGEIVCSREDAPLWQHLAIEE